MGTEPGLRFAFFYEIWFLDNRPDEIFVLIKSIIYIKLTAYFGSNPNVVQSDKYDSSIIQLSINSSYHSLTFPWWKVGKNQGHFKLRNQLLIQKNVH